MPCARASRGASVRASAGSQWGKEAQTMAAASYKICTLPGDGIGPEIMGEAKRLLAVIGEAYDVNFN